ncbi:MAG: hypothetical protein ACK5Y2_13505 [Bdellovibrionales bacterium]|jgi:hypothetical protein
MTTLTEKLGDKEVASLKDGNLVDVVIGYEVIIRTALDSFDFLKEK